MTPKGSRSPTAPSRSLQVCFTAASSIYGAYGHTEFGGAEIAAKANLSAGSGAARSLVSDLKQYGLIEKRTAGRFSISQATKNLVAMTPETADFKAAAFQLVKNPAVFNDVLDACKGKLPEESALASNLRAAQHFNQAKADATAKALSESLDWVGVLDGKRNILEPRDAAAARQEEGEPNEGGARIGDWEGHEGEVLASGVLSLDIPLSGGRIAKIRYPQDLSPEEAIKIGKVLAAICE